MAGTSSQQCNDDDTHFVDPHALFSVFCATCAVTRSTTTNMQVQCDAMLQNG